MRRHLDAQAAPNRSYHCMSCLSRPSGSTPKFRKPWPGKTWPKLSVSQQVPFPGKLGLRQEVARRALERTDAEVAAKRLSVAAMISEAYYDLYYLYQLTDHRA